MGYPMALNLRKGLGKEYTLLICDVVQDALSKFQVDAEGLGPVEVVQNGFEAVKKAVSSTSLFPTRSFSPGGPRSRDDRQNPQNTVITMLPDSPAVRKVYLDPSTGIIAGAESSSTSPSPLKSSSWNAAPSKQAQSSTSPKPFNNPPPPKPSPSPTPPSPAVPWARKTEL